MELGRVAKSGCIAHASVFPRPPAAAARPAQHCQRAPALSTSSSRGLQRVHAVASPAAVEQDQRGANYCGDGELAHLISAGTKYTLVKLYKDSLNAGVQMRTVKQCLDFATILSTVLRLS